MTAEELRLDYFRFYDVGIQGAGFPVWLQGQFDEGRETTRVSQLTRLGVRGSKSGQPLFDENAHLNWYRVWDPTPEPTRWVKLENQFGEQEIHIGNAVALLAPARKYEEGSAFPKRLDHFKVYSVLEGGWINERVKVEDQFEHSEARVYYLAYFGVPVTKWWQGEVTEPRNPEAHLAIYKIYPRTVRESRLVRDQFGRRILTIYRSVLLGAPSRKNEWREV